ncbi:relaxase/mobilization nuclease domain-containing protein (plasmid) [Carnobacterium viridans]|uniref:Relaxase/Mobilisation nuclease domain-containing protein n=1 Tax=Carnobacterium viridans TaxID=174587 RepID=A0A1H0XI52_9LACT|nr:relaxase/mobilization nuclease domain-containing protein [Carnobacterium viridans]UDE96446.1 relaxase/mobilization nuclease domain-containing protein [Carnobacterium viridans]SDQ02598.1 Relaxase/Mobilisation nuclease domain-containing protein [Carnobacterium viridans]
MGAIIKIASATKNGSATVNYIARQGKIDVNLTSAHLTPLDYQAAREQMRQTRDLMGKTKGRQGYHLVQSFDATDQLTPMKAHQFGQEFMSELSKMYPDHEIYMATHTDTDHPHNHFMINAVNSETGAKMAINPPDIYEMHEINNDISKKHDLVELTKAKNKVYPTEIAAYTQIGKQYERDLVKEKIYHARDQAHSYPEFEHLLSESDVTLTSEIGKRGQTIRQKYVTHDSEGKQWTFTASRLGEDFKKEPITHAIMEHQRKRDKQQSDREQLERSNTERLRGLTASVREVADEVRAERRTHESARQPPQNSPNVNRDFGPER